MQTSNLTKKIVERDGFFHAFLLQDSEHGVAQELLWCKSYTTRAGAQRALDKQAK
jgi:hypothetical protein